MGDNQQEQVKLRTEKIVWRTVGEEMIALDTVSSQYLSVNKTAAAVWPLLQEGCTRADIASALVERFGIEQERAGADADKLVSSLREMGLLD